MAAAGTSAGPRHSSADELAGAGDSRSSLFDEMNLAHEQKRQLKKQIRQWEIEFEESHGGLIPTHEDKKHDAKYLQIKAQAKTAEKVLEHARAKTRQVTRAAKAERSRLSSSKQSEASHGYDAGGGARRSSGGLDRLGVTSSSLASSSADDDGTRNAFTFEGGRISLSPFHVIAMLFACAVPYALFMMGFALMGFGAMVFDYLVSSGSLFYPLSLSAVALLVVLYLFDVSYWVHPLAVWLRRLLLSVAGATVVLGGTLASKEYPYAPMLLLFFLAPGYWWLLHLRLFHNWPLNNFLQVLFIALVLLSFGAAALWVAWVLNGNNWDLPNKRK